MDAEDCQRAASLLDLPKPALAAVVAAAWRRRRSDPRSVCALRASCSVLRALIDERMTDARFGGYGPLGLSEPGLRPPAARHLARFPNLSALRLPPDDDSGFQLAAVMRELPGHAWPALASVAGRASAPLLRELLRQLPRAARSDTHQGTAGSLEDRAQGPAAARSIPRLALEFGEYFESDQDSREIARLLAALAEGDADVALHGGVDALAALSDAGLPMACVTEVSIFSAEEPGELDHSMLRLLAKAFPRLSSLRTAGYPLCLEPACAPPPLPALRALAAAADGGGDLAALARAAPGLGALELQLPPGGLLDLSPLAALPRLASLSLSCWDDAAVGGEWLRDGADPGEVAAFSNVVARMTAAHEPAGAGGGGAAVDLASLSALTRLSALSFGSLAALGAARGAADLPPRLAALAAAAGGRLRALRLRAGAAGEGPAAVLGAVFASPLACALEEVSLTGLWAPCGQAAAALARGLAGARALRALALRFDLFPGGARGAAALEALLRPLAGARPPALREVAVRLPPLPHRAGDAGGGDEGGGGGGGAAGMWGGSFIGWEVIERLEATVPGLRVELGEGDGWDEW